MSKRIIIKIGGNVIDNPNLLNSFLHDFSTIKDSKILIHGGGKLASDLSNKLNIPAKLIDGRRITDEATLDIVTMVYAGSVNKKIVAQLQKNNCNAIGISGVDANFIEAHKRKHATIDFGFVGDIDKVNTEILSLLSKANIIPVIAPITHDNNGQLLNTNADTIAAEIANELSKSEKTTLIYCFEKKGLLEDVNNSDSWIPFVSTHEIQQLIDKQIITGGMLPKIANIINALENGVEKVILCQAQDLLAILNGNSTFGTTFIND